MCETLAYKNKDFQAQQGFTLVELVTVVMVLGILALAIVPRFTGTSGYTEFALQKRIVSALRNTQLKAMYDTRNGFCYRINLINGNDVSAAFGPSTQSYLPGNEIASCASTIDLDSPDFLRTETGEINDKSLRLSAFDATNVISYIQFDNAGRAYSSVGNCSAGCTITFSGESDASVCVGDQGYVYAC